MKEVIVIVLISAVCITGYVKNIIGLTQCDFEAPYKCEVVRVIGIVPVVGAITGYLDLGT